MAERFSFSGSRPHGTPSGQRAGAAQGADLAQIAIVAAKFNSRITTTLVDGAIDVLKSFTDREVRVYWVPGAFEIPLTCDRLFHAKSLHGIIALGAVIRGETPHFDYVAGECAKGCTAVSLKHQKPVIFGVLTTNTIEQALNRAGLKMGNKGAEAALALIDLLKLYGDADI